MTFEFLQLQVIGTLTNIAVELKLFYQIGLKSPSPHPQLLGQHPSLSQAVQPGVQLGTTRLLGGDQLRGYGLGNEQLVVGQGG